jgi:tetratricopeptide (TPR) repeat protein
MLFLRLTAIAFFISIITIETKAELVGYWQFNDNDNKVAYDSSDNGYDGKFMGGARNVTDPERGSVLYVTDGGHVDCGNHPAFNITDKLTLAAWIKMDTPSSYGQIIYRLFHNQDIGWIKPWILYGIGMHASSQMPSGHINRNDDVVQIISTQALEMGTWHHIAMVSQVTSENTTRYDYYIDGVLNQTEFLPGTTAGAYDPKGHLYIGSQYEHISIYIDEAIVFDHALQEEEIHQLYLWGGTPFLSDSSRVFVEAAQKAEAMLQENKMEEVIDTLKKSTTEYENWVAQEPNKAALSQEYLANLYFLLAQAKETQEAQNTNEIASLYAKGIQKGRFLLSDNSPALLRLFRYVSPDEYKKVILYSIQNDYDYLKGMANYAGKVSKQDFESYIRFLESNLSIYHRWREENPLLEVAVENRLPEIYMALAQTKEAAQSPQEEIADAYSKTFKRSHHIYDTEQCQALLKLLKMESEAEYKKAIQFVLQKQEDSRNKIFRTVCTQLEEEKNWPPFQAFLDALFFSSETCCKGSIFVESCLQDPTNHWGRQYFSYLEEKPEIRFGRDWEMAKQYAAEGNYEQAAVLYQDLLKRSSEKDNRGELAFQRCKSLFYAGHYEEALTEMESFIRTYKGNHRNLVIETMLMQGSAYVQLDELDKAIEIFFQTVIEYPEIEDTPRICFLMGYCYMMQNKFEEADKSFTILIRNFPNDPYTAKAELCLVRMKQMNSEDPVISQRTN